MADPNTPTEDPNAAKVAYVDALAAQVHTKPAVAQLIDRAARGELSDEQAQRLHAMLQDPAPAPAEPLDPEVARAVAPALQKANAALDRLAQMEAQQRLKERDQAIEDAINKHPVLSGLASGEEGTQMRQIFRENLLAKLTAHPQFSPQQHAETIGNVYGKLAQSKYQAQHQAAKAKTEDQVLSPSAGSPGTMTPPAYEPLTGVYKEGKPDEARIRAHRDSWFARYAANQAPNP